VSHTDGGLIEGLQGTAGTVDFGQDLLSRFGPHEPLGIRVVLIDEGLNGRLQLVHAFEGSATNLFPSQFAEPAFDKIQPELLMGVKWMWNRGCRASHFCTFGCLCVA